MLLSIVILYATIAAHNLSITTIASSYSVNPRGDDSYAWQHIRIATIALYQLLPTTSQTNPPTMPPTESNLLTHFLLPPASLPTALPLSKFQTLFPASLQTSPSVKTLYADLHSQKTTDITLLRKNITTETERGKLQIREMRRERRKKDTTTTTQTETSRHDERGRGREPHTSTTLLPSLSTAQKAMEAEIAALEKETSQILEEMRITVGDLSDLRYGRFQKTPGADTDLRDEVLEALGKVRESAEGVRDRRR